MSMQEPAYLDYVPLVTKDGSPSPYKMASLVIHRPHKANAFDRAMLEKVTALLEQVKKDKSIRLLVFQGTGKHFTGGADLSWMLESAKMSHAENLAEATKLTTMFEALSWMDIPTVAVVRGAVYGIGVGIVACCDFAIADESATFSLNEALIGLIPAVVLPYVNRKVDCGQLRRHVLGGKSFSGPDARDYRLVQVLAAANDLGHTVKGELNQLLMASPEAQGSYKRLQKYLGNNSYQQGPFTAAAIAIARASDFGQVGLRCYLQNEPAPWLCQIPEDHEILPRLDP